MDFSFDDSMFLISGADGLVRVFKIDEAQWEKHVIENIICISFIFKLINPY